jgi:hypothetical protein
MNAQQISEEAKAAAYTIAQNTNNASLGQYWLFDEYILEQSREVQTAINSATAKLQEENKALRECAEEMAEMVKTHYQCCCCDVIHNGIEGRMVCERCRTLATFHKLKGV